MAGEFTAYSMIMIPNLTEADTRFLVMRAKLVGAELATALAICKADTGRYPAGLAELKPKYLAELPVDPFTGKPFEYAATEGGGVVHSSQRRARRRARSGRDCLRSD